jgi:ATP sulfurylase
MGKLIALMAIVCVLGACSHKVVGRAHIAAGKYASELDAWNKAYDACLAKDKELVLFEVINLDRQLNELTAKYECQ